MSQTRFKQTEKPKRCAFVGCVRPCKNKKRLKVGRVHVHTSSFLNLCQESFPRRKTTFPTFQPSSTPTSTSQQYSNDTLPPNLKKSRPSSISFFFLCHHNSGRPPRSTPYPFRIPISPLFPFHHISYRPSPYPIELPPSNTHLHFTKISGILHLILIPFKVQAFSPPSSFVQIIFHHLSSPLQQN